MARRIAYDLPMEIRLADGSALEGYASVARGYWQRLWGLMGQRAVPEASGLLFPRCPSIHTFWMRVPIDVLWLARPGADGVTCDVVGLERSLAPGLVRVGPPRAWGVLEMAAGTFGADARGLEPLTVAVGDLRPADLR